MKIMPMGNPQAVIAALFLAALCALSPSLASAQTRDNVYAVGGIHVDQTAANAAAAQQAGFAAAQQRGFERLVRRLTVPEELVQRGMPVAQGAALDALVLSVDVEEERRSGTRYIGRLTVRFDPTGIRTLLRQQGLTIVDTRTCRLLTAALVRRQPRCGAKFGAQAASVMSLCRWRLRRKRCKARRLGPPPRHLRRAPPQPRRSTPRCARKAAW
jgi:hypothetical protein